MSLQFNIGYEQCLEPCSPRSELAIEQECWLGMENITQKQLGLSPQSNYGQELYLFHIVQSGSGTGPTTNPLGTGAFFLSLKRLGREADHSPS
jgi:hypothetical protein